MDGAKGSSEYVSLIAVLGGSEVVRLVNRYTAPGQDALRYERPFQA